MDYAALFAQAQSYHEFLATYGTEEQQRRWQTFYDQVQLTDEQKALLSSFVREMKVLALAGAWCGDCVNQCPIWEHFAAVNPRIQIRYLDRDAHPEFAAEMSMCGGQRVPAVLFLSEDDQPCGRYGDRTLSRYRYMAQTQLGAACPTGLVPDADSLTAAVVQDWLNEFERIQLMLRTSGRLREKHGD